MAGISRPPALNASSACDAVARSGASKAEAISRSAPWARSAAGPIAPLAIERIVTTSPGGMFGGAGAPAALRGRSADGGGWMAAESNLSVSGHTDGGGTKAAHRDSGLVQRGDAR